MSGTKRYSERHNESPGSTELTSLDAPFGSYALAALDGACLALSMRR